MSRIGLLAVELGAALAALAVTPLIAGPGGCVAVAALGAAAPATILEA